MRRNLLAIFLVLVLMISACGAQAPLETATPTQAESQLTTPTPTATEAPSTASETPPAQVSATSTPITPIPTNSSDCINSAAFVADVTVPDRSEIAAGTTFKKTWRIRNTGTCIWGPDYSLSHYSEERMLAQSPIPLQVTYPNQTTELSLDLIAPNATGTHRGYFVIKNPAGLIMKIDNDSRLWVIINVTVTATSAATTAAGSITSTASSGGDGLANAACAFTTDQTKVTDVIITLNAYRAQNGLPAYTPNELLAKAAAAHSSDMACNKLFVHTGSNGSTPTTRVAASGYSAATVTENVYGSFPPLSGQEVVNWWKTDQTDLRHNQNLLSAAYTEIGVGYSFFNNFGYYVLVFASPK